MTFAVLSKKRKQLLGSATKRYLESRDERTLEYFNSRGLDRDTLDEFQIGTVVEPADDSHEMYIGRAVIPYVTKTGVVNLKFRCIEDHRCKDYGHEKYYSLSGYGTRLYNTLALFQDSGAIAITEGEIDAMSIQAILGMPAIGYPGATQWQGNKHWPLIFEGYSTVWVVADGDKPGRDAAKEVAATMRNAQVVRCKDGEDANSLLQTEEGQEWLAERLKIN